MTKSYDQLVPSVERRLSAWIAVGDQRAKRQATADRPTITISRKFGCEAFPLSERLKEILDRSTGETWNIYDRALLERVSQDEHLSMELLEDLGGPSRAADALGFFFVGHLPHDAAFRRVARHILRIAELGNAIIVGRGAAIIAQKLPNCYHFRLDASVDFRVASIARRMEVSEKEARKIVRDGDARREKFVGNCLHASVSDLGYYDAIFNNARHSVAEIARSIVAYVAEHWEDKKYFTTVA